MIVIDFPEISPQGLLRISVSGVGSYFPQIYFSGGWNVASLSVTDTFVDIEMAPTAKLGPKIEIQAVPDRDVAPVVKVGPFGPGDAMIGWTTANGPTTASLYSNQATTLTGYVCVLPPPP